MENTNPKLDIYSVTNEGIAINCPVDFGLQVFHIAKPWETQNPKLGIYSLTNEGIVINPVDFGLQVFHIVKAWKTQIQNWIFIQ